MKTRLTVAVTALLAACEATPRLSAPTPSTTDAEAAAIADAGAAADAAPAPTTDAGDNAMTGRDAESTADGTLPADSGAEPIEVPALPADNPFAGATMYLNPDYQAAVDAAAALEPADRA